MIIIFCFAYKTFSQTSENDNNNYYCFIQNSLLYYWNKITTIVSFAALNKNKQKKHIPNYNPRRWWVLQFMSYITREYVLDKELCL